MHKYWSVYTYHVNGTSVSKIDIDMNKTLPCCIRPLGPFQTLERIRTWKVAWFSSVLAWISQNNMFFLFSFGSPYLRLCICGLPALEDTPRPRLFASNVGEGEVVPGWILAVTLQQLCQHNISQHQQSPSQPIKAHHSPSQPITAPT